MAIIKALPERLNGFKIVKDLGRKKGFSARRAKVECKVCKEIYEIDVFKLKYRKSCGCINNGGKRSKYAKSHPRILRIYKCVMARCYYKKDTCYHIYGQKGIRVCKEWKGKPDSFCEWALENGYEEHLTIDRLDNAKGYSPENCKWATLHAQSRNRSCNKLNMKLAEKIREDKMRLNLNNAELAIIYKVARSTIINVIHNRSWIK